MQIKPKKLINNEGYEKILQANKFYDVGIEYSTTYIDDMPIPYPMFVLEHKKTKYHISINRFDLKATEGKK